MAFDEKKIPKLPYGEGNIRIYDDNLLVYRKVIKFEDGTKIRKAVYGKTPKECMVKMKEAERIAIESHATPRSKELLCDALDKWADTVKKQTLKEQSYRRLKSVIKNQITVSNIGHYYYQSITTEEIQDVINNLNINNFSHSTIKKTYDCLNDFYRYASAKDKIDNPMLLVVMPTINNIKAETRTIEFLNSEDINLFVEECGKRYNTNSLKYKYGYVLAANIYLGLRIGELLALQWKDINFEKGTIYICKTLIEAQNEEFDENDLENMKLKGIKKTKFFVQNSTKKSKNRYVPINTKAKELLMLHKNNSEFTEEDDYVISTRNRKTNTIKNIGDMIKSIEENAGTSIQNSGTHVLRHTCASLYFRSGVPIETICTILGNTREVCEKTYVHFIEEQLQSAANKLASELNNIELK